MMEFGWIDGWMNGRMEGCGIVDGWMDGGLPGERVLGGGFVFFLVVALRGKSQTLLSFSQIF